MGSIKDAQTNEEKSFILSDAEFNYLLNIHKAKQNIAQEYNRVTSAFLYYIASSRLKYAPDENLQFEMDFSDPKRTLKITIMPKETETTS